MLIKKRDFRRVSNIRNVKKIFVIATEGEKTEPIYFNDLKALLRNPIVYVAVLERQSSASSPNHVLNELDKFKSHFELKSDDELWILIDKDNWGNRNLSITAAQCVQKKYHLAVSNPCFEVWLLLHLRDISRCKTDKIKALSENKNRDLEKEIRCVCGYYNKSNPDTSKFLPNINTAIKRAKKLDINPQHRWTNSISTRVYRLAEKIIQN